MSTKTNLFVAALFCGSALAPAAYAQTAGGASEARTGAAAEACADLRRIASENSERFQREWIDGANRIVRRGRAEECQPYVQAAEDALDQNRGADAQSRIVVEQPEPQVTVQQEAPEISVSQGQPQVSVNQGRPQIIVRQAQPTVRIDVPQPTVTIDQPEPEIIVRMPEPDVRVSTPEPEIEVSQNQPEVSVRQRPPQVNVEIDEPEVDVNRADRAQVEVERDQAVVRREQAEGQPEINISRGEPQVSYERAEPNVEVTSSGEPNVEFTQSGEPTVRFEEGSREQAATGRDRDMSERMQPSVGAAGDASRVDRENTASTTPDAENDRDTALRGDGGSEPGGDMMRLRVETVIDREVRNMRGDELGMVSRLVTDGSEVYAVLAHGGFLGLGEREVALPLDRMSVSRNREQLVLRGLTEGELDELPRFDPATADALGDSQVVEVGSL